MLLFLSQLQFSLLSEVRISIQGEQSIGGVIHKHRRGVLWCVGGQAEVESIQQILAKDCTAAARGYHYDNYLFMLLQLAVQICRQVLRRVHLFSVACDAVQM